MLTITIEETRKPFPVKKLLDSLVKLGNDNIF
jgi:hypothetical protein